MKTPNATISKAELDVLKALWKSGAGTVREVGARLNRRRRRWAYTTVQTLLCRLEVKGYVSCERSGVPHVFRAAVSRDKLVRLRLRDLADNLCEGTAIPLVMALVREERFSEMEIEQFRRLLETMEPRK